MKEGFGVLNVEPDSLQALKDCLGLAYVPYEAWVEDWNLRCASRKNCSTLQVQWHEEIGPRKDDPHIHQILPEDLLFHSCECDKIECLKTEIEYEGAEY